MPNVTPSLLMPTYVDTPIGRLKFYPSHIDGELDNIALTQSAIDPYLPPGMDVIKCIAVLLQFSVTKSVTELCFCCDWELFKEKGGVHSGEGLDAWEWEHENHLVMVGTEDAEYLSKRISLLPFGPSDYPITMAENKVRIRLQNLPAGQCYSLHFIVAWNDFPETHEGSCWYAVDVPHEKVKKLLVNSSPNQS